LRRRMDDALTVQMQALPSPYGTYTRRSVARKFNGI
jgi:hypothetical protein